MKNYMEEYYYMVPTGINSPLLDFVDSMTDSFMLYKKEALDENYLIRFRLGEPIPRNPKMGDAHNNAQHLVISDKLKETMQTLQLRNVQYLPASIENFKNAKLYENYWALHIYNLINCLDKEKSEFDTFGDTNDIVSIDELVFDNEILDKIPLEERLVFALGEKRLYMFFHASVVEKLVALQPQGVVFCSLAKWSDGFPFEQAFSEYILEAIDDDDDY